MATLHERLGGSDGIARLSAEIVDRHRENPLLAPRFADVDAQALKKSVTAFFVAGTGGPDAYEGDDMRTAHKGMNIDSEEFVAVLDDALAAMEHQGVGQREREEVLFVLYGMKDGIVRV